MMKLAMNLSSFTHVLPPAMLLVAVRAANDSVGSPSGEDDGKYVINNISAKDFHEYCENTDLIHERECLSSPEVLLGELQKLDPDNVITEDTLLNLERQIFDAFEQRLQTRDKRFDNFVMKMKTMMRMLRRMEGMEDYDDSTLRELIHMSSNKLTPFMKMIFPVICKKSGMAFGGVPAVHDKKPDCTEDFWLQLTHKGFPDFTIALITAQRVTFQKDHGDTPAGTKIAHMVGIHKSSAYQVYELLRRYEILDEDVMPETIEKGFVSQAFVYHIRDIIAKECKYLFVTPTNGFERTLQKHYGFENVGPETEVSMDGGETWQPHANPMDTHNYDGLKMFMGIDARATQRTAVYEVFEHAKEEDTRLNGGCFVLKLQEDRESDSSGAKPKL